MGIKVHLGCWHRFIPGFVHVDLCDMPHIDYRSGIDCLPFFTENSVELIYCSHALEYFDREQAALVLKEWYRILEPGGLLRLAVPNFEALIRVYQMTGELTSVLGPLYGKMCIDTSNGKNVLYHKTTYDLASLSKLLIQCNFVEPEIWDWRKTEHTQVDDHSQAYFPHMQKDTGIHVSLNLQAKKR